MKRTLLFATLALLGTAAPVFAHGHGEGKKGARFERMSEKLGLDDAGKARLKQTFDKYRSQMAPLWQDARLAHQDLEAELAAAQPDERKLSALTSRLQSDRQKMQTVREQRSTELKSVLTPSQFARLMLAQHHRSHRHQEKNQ